MFRTRIHIIFLLSGIAIAVLLGIHMSVQHLNNVIFSEDPDPTSWISMIGRAAQDGWVVIYILLLAFALFHGLYALRGMILEVTASPVIVCAINWIFIVGGFAVFGWASYVPISLLIG